MIIRHRGLLTLVLCAALVLAIGRAWGALIGDHAWFESLGYADVWWWRTSVALTLKCGAGAIGTLVMRAHLEAVRRSFVSVVLPDRVGNLDVVGAVSDRTISTILWGVALLVGIVLTVPVGDWIPLANVLDARPFGEADPYFQYDIAFWTNWLPFELQAYAWALIAHAGMCLLTIMGYLVTRGITTDGRALRITRHARRHITVLGAILLVLIAWSYRLDGFQRLIGVGGSDGGFGFADHRIGLPGSIVMQVIAIAAAGVVTWSAWSQQPRAAIAAVTTVLLMALLLRQAMPLLADSVEGGGDVVARERRYQETRAAFTRRAYESDRVVAAERSDTASISATPLWDRGTIPATSGARVGALLSWDDSRGIPSAVVFDAMRTNGWLPTWNALPFDVTAENPLRAINARSGRVLPPIVVSDSGRGYAIVSDPARHIAAPLIASTSSRLAHAWNQQNPRLLMRPTPQPSPVLVTVRDVRERVALVVPSLRRGAHVIPVSYADSLLWALDLYAVSATYPLAEHAMLDGDEYAAVQFAATALVNAHTGRVSIVVESDLPLLARQPLRRLQTHVLSVAALPEALRQALPPRADALGLEAAIAARYGSRALEQDSASWIRGGGRLRDYSLVRGASGDSALARDDVVPVWLPSRHEYALTAAAVDVRGVVRGVLLAPGGRDRRTRWLPNAEGVAYEGVIRAMQEATDSLRQPGSLSGARRGTTRVLPGAGAPRFLTPFFSVRDGRPSQVTAVLLTDGVRRGVGGTVTDAMLVWSLGSRPPAPGTAAAAMYRQMRAALRRGAWVEFGASLDALGRVLGVAPDSSPR